MTVSYPLSFPDQVENSFVLFPENVIGVSEAEFTLQQQVHAHDGDRWVLELSLPPIKERADAVAVCAFVMKLRGRYGTFLWGPKLLKDPRGTWAGTPLVDGVQTGYTLLIDGLSAGATVKAGDLFQVDNQLYMNLTDQTETAGAITLDIWPRARGHANNAPLITANPKGIFRLIDNAPRAVSVDAMRIYTTTIRAVEAK